MSHVVVNPEVDLPPRSGDQALSAELLAQLELFAALKKKLSFDKFPGSTILRRYRAGEVICRQGDAGASAYYVLTTSDLLAIRESQLAAANDAATLARLTQTVTELQLRLEAVSSLPRDAAERQSATALLQLAGEAAARPRGLLTGWTNWRSKRSSQQAPASIVIDGPSDIDYATRRAPIFEGELFGEMSCMTLAPRSATVVAMRDCYLLEFLRNIFDQLQRDPGYQARLDTLYRERVLANHLKRLEILAGLTDEELAYLREHAELVRAEPGQVIFDQGDASDSVYLIRSGLVQVVTDTHVALRPEDVVDWDELVAQLGRAELASAAAANVPTITPEASSAAKAKSADPLSAVKAKSTTPVSTPEVHLWQAIDSSVHEALSLARDAHNPEARNVVWQDAILSALNRCARDREWLAAKPLLSIVEHPEVIAQARLFPKGIAGIKKDWTDLEVRAVGRVVLQIMLAGCFRPRPQHGPPRVLAYLSRGDVFGEMGVLRNQPRSTTCVAYDHPPDPKRSSVPVDLVRIEAEVFRDFVRQSPLLRQRVEALIHERQQRDLAVRARPAWDAAQAVTSSPDFQQLGLIQGQKLLLVDLDRCTRCGDCVTACINTHDDGRSRLYLDGPRFDRYLVPSACRNCLNPACMIGCPVGSIQRGDDGQILIRDWCIGCGLCADQCPYDSIQMHDLALVSTKAIGWRVAPLAFVKDRNWQTKTYRDHTWSAGMGPFNWNLELQALLGNFGKVSGALLDQAVCFRYHFDSTRDRLSADRQYQLTLVTQGAAAEVWLNGKLVTMTCEEAQRRGENRKLRYEAFLAANQLQRGENVLAVLVQPEVQPGDRVLELQLAQAAQQLAVGGDKTVAVKQVDQHAVVCDLCSSLPSGPACVTMCPHDAAQRVDARFGFPGA